MAIRISGSLFALAKYVPPLGRPIAFDSQVCDSVRTSADRANRNRWARLDLNSAIGRDLHEGDPSSETWPPIRSRR